MMRLAYTVASYCVTPFLVGRLLWRGRRDFAYLRRIGERFGLGSRIAAQRGCVWIHAVSVGEVQAASPIVKALGSLYPDETIVVTSMTATGAGHVSKAFGRRVVHRYFPFDLPGSVARFLNRVAPRVAIIMETEIWPNLLTECRRRGIPVILANVRLSERSAAGYRRFRSLFAPVLGDVAAVAAQSREDARRVASVGAPPDLIDVTGSTKFDIPMRASLREEATTLRRMWGVSRGIWIAASTHKGEEAVVLDAFEQVLERLPESLLVLVPRHPERFRDVAAYVSRRGFEPSMRSQRPADCAGVKVFIGDTMGELPLFYAAADVAFVGGTLVERGGHNMLEPAALGLPVLFGPHVFNFAEISHRLIESGGARTVGDAASLGQAVVDYLCDSDLRHTTGSKGRAFVEDNRGAGDRVVALINSYLERARRFPAGRCAAAESPRSTTASQPPRVGTTAMSTEGLSSAQTASTSWMPDFSNASNGVSSFTRFSSIAV